MDETGPHEKGWQASFVIFEQHSMLNLQMCGFVGGVLVDRPVHFDTELDAWADLSKFCFHLPCDLLNCHQTWSWSTFVKCADLKNLYSSWQQWPRHADVVFCHVTIINRGTMSHFINRDHRQTDTKLACVKLKRVKLRVWAINSVSHMPWPHMEKPEHV